MVAQLRVPFSGESPHELEQGLRHVSLGLRQRVERLAR